MSENDNVDEKSIWLVLCVSQLLWLKNLYREALWSNNNSIFWTFYSCFLVNRSVGNDGPQFVVWTSTREPREVWPVSLKGSLRVGFKFWLLQSSRDLLLGRLWLTASVNIVFVPKKMERNEFEDIIFECGDYLDFSHVDWNPSVQSLIGLPIGSMVS